MTEQSKGHLYVLIGITCVGVIGPLAKLSLRELSPIWYVVWLYLISIPLSYPFGQKLFIPHTKREGSYFLLHLIGIAIGWYCAASGLTILDAATATFIGRVEFPILMIISMLVLKEKLGKIIWPCIALSLTGLTLLTEKGVLQDLLNLDPGKNLAVFLLAFGAMGFATGELGTKVLAKKYPARSFTFMRNLVMGPLVFSIAMLTEGWSQPSKTAILYTALSALAGPVLARIFYMEGLKRIPLGHATVITQLEPVLTLLFVFLLGMEMPNKKEYLGCSFIFASSLLLVANHWVPKRTSIHKPSVESL